MNSNNYNSLVKLASATPRAPKPQPAVNPATGGTRIMYKGHPVGPLRVNHRLRKGPLPITPYSSGKINIKTTQQAKQQAEYMEDAIIVNDYRKELNAQDFDAMFKNLHETNQRRRAVGLPDYTPTAMDVYAPYANSEEDYANAQNSIHNDIRLSTTAHEAARRGTPLNAAELTELVSWGPHSAQISRERRSLQGPTHNNMGLKLPADIPGTSPQEMGETANGIWDRENVYKLKY